MADVAGRRWQLWHGRVEEESIADLSTWDLIARSGLEPRWFVEDDFTMCWAITRLLKDCGYRGLLSPTAARHEQYVNLTLFGPRREIPFSEAGLDEDRYWIPVEPVGTLSEPDTAILSRVRYRKERHRGLEIWNATSAKQ